jgi:hypothetical protein
MEARRIESQTERVGGEEMLAHVGNRTAVVQSVSGHCTDSCLCCICVEEDWSV